MSLSQLRDIHLPAPISLWPLAPGWYALAVLILFSLGICGWLIYRRLQLSNWQRVALQELEELKQRFELKQLNRPVMLELSTLLKRAALAQYPRADVAGLTGNSWLEFLDQQGKTNTFTKGVGRLLITAPYQAHTPAEVWQVFALVGAWLKKPLHPSTSRTGKKRKGTEYV